LLEPIEIYQLWVAMGTGITGILISGGLLIKDFFFKPKLKFEFDKTKPAIYKPEAELYNENLQHLGKRKWLNLM